MYGQEYLISNPTAGADINVPTSGSPVDLVALTAAAAVPFYVWYLQVNCGVNAAQIQKLNPVMRSTPGTGAAGSLGIRNASPSGPAASMAANYLVATPGALSGTPIWSEDWQQFGGFEQDRRDKPILVPSGMTIAIPMPTVPVGFTMNVNGMALEVK